jgi:hypothetical protein
MGDHLSHEAAPILIGWCRRALEPVAFFLLTIWGAGELKQQ